jgi:hypothetical protein
MTNSDRFKVTREDGRSNADVVIDLVKDGVPPRVYQYDEIIDALHVGTEHSYTIRDVQGIVARLYPRLLKEQARALHNIRGVGYRIAPAGYHLVLANHRHDKADKQLLRAMQTLEHVRWDEMDANQRMAHEGQLLISAAMYQQMKALERRTSAVEDAIQRVIGRVDKK